jgi:hypothetical protein
MNHARVLTIVIAAPALSVLHAQWLNYPTLGMTRLSIGRPNFNAPVPKTADAKPDLSGVLDRLSPKYRINIAADLKPGEVQPWARALVEQRTENMDSKASDETKSEVNVAPEILARYVGTFIERLKLWRVVPRMVETTFSDGVLFGNMDGRGAECQIPRSVTNLSGFAGLVHRIRQKQPGRGYQSLSQTRVWRLPVRKA